MGDIEGDYCETPMDDGSLDERLVRLVADFRKNGFDLSNKIYLKTLLMGNDYRPDSDNPTTLSKRQDDKIRVVTYVDNGNWSRWDEGLSYYELDSMEMYQEFREILNGAIKEPVSFSKTFGSGLVTGLISGMGLSALFYSKDVEFDPLFDYSGMVIIGLAGALAGAIAGTVYYKDSKNSGHMYQNSFNMYFADGSKRNIDAIYEALDMPKPNTDCMVHDP